MSESVTVVLTLLSAHLERARHLTNGDIEGNEQNTRKIAQDVYLVDIVSHDVKFGNLEIEKVLINNSIPFSKKWEGCSYFPEGEQHLRVNELGTPDLIELESSIPTGEESQNLAREFIKKLLKVDAVKELDPELISQEANSIINKMDQASTVPVVLSWVQQAFISLKTPALDSMLQLRVHANRNLFAQAGEAEDVFLHNEMDIHDPFVSAEGESVDPISYYGAPFLSWYLKV